MNFGKMIQELRKKKDITQEDLAAQLGVTAAAVSKWENGYTLPDILMLCAIADLFEVTTDELLGRNPKAKYAVIATDSQVLGTGLKEKAKSYGFITKAICGSFADALGTAKNDPSITHLFASFENPLRGEEKDEMPDSLCCVESHASKTEQALDGFDIYFRNIPAYDSLMKKHPIKET